MSSLSLSQAEVIHDRRAPVSGRILILGGLFVLVLLLVVVISTAHADLASRPAVLQNSTVPIAVPVPTPADAHGQTISTGTTALSLEETNAPTVVAIPAPTPPAQ